MGTQHEVRVSSSPSCKRVPLALGMGTRGTAGFCPGLALMLSRGLGVSPMYLTRGRSEGTSHCKVGDVSDGREGNCKVLVETSAAKP